MTAISIDSPFNQNYSFYVADEIFSRPQVVHKATAWPGRIQSSGSYFDLTISFNPSSGLSGWLDRILSGEEEEFCPITSAEVPQALIEIRDVFSLNTVQLNRIFHVTRQTIYNWRDGKSVDIENRKRIAKIKELSNHWTDAYKIPMGRISSEEIAGISLVELLSQDDLDKAAILSHFRQISDRLAANFHEKPKAARELAAAHGIQYLSEAERRRNLAVASLRNQRNG